MGGGGGLVWLGGAALWAVGGRRRVRWWFGSAVGVGWPVVWLGGCFGVVVVVWFGGLLLVGVLFWGLRSCWWVFLVLAVLAGWFSGAPLGSGEVVVDGDVGDFVAAHTAGSGESDAANIDHSPFTHCGVDLP